MTKTTNPEASTHAANDATAVGKPVAEIMGRADNEKSDRDGGGEAAINDGEVIANLRTENTELKDRLLRALAEIENVRRRAEREIDDTRQYAIAKFAGDMLSVADNMQRAIASVPTVVRASDPAVKTLIGGIELTEKEMLRLLEKHGVRKLDPKGKRFDPNFHQAMFEVPDPSMPSGTVAHVVEDGYSIGSRVLRAAKVAIAPGGTKPPDTG